MVVEQGLVARRVGELGGRQACPQRRGRQVMERVPVDLGYSGPQVATHEELIPFQLRLEDDQREVGLGVHVARHLLDFLDLLLDMVVDAVEEPVGWPADR